MSSYITQAQYEQEVIASIEDDVPVPEQVRGLGMEYLVRAMLALEMEIELEMGEFMLVNGEQDWGNVE